MTDVTALQEASQQQNQIHSGVVTTTGSAAQLDIDFLHYPKSLLEIVLISDVSANFDVMGSIDGVNYYTAETISVVGGVMFFGKFDNAHRYVRILSDTVGNQTIIIAGAR